MYSKRDLRNAYGEVKGHVLHLHAYWKIYRKLYRGNEYSAPILATVGSELFNVLGKALPRIIFLIFRQLTDSSCTMGHQNASFRGLLEVAAGSNYEVDHFDLVDLIENIDGNRTVRDHVNRYIAHIDFELVAGIAAVPLDVEIHDVEDALEATRQFMDKFGSRFLHEQPFRYLETAEILASQIDDLVETVRVGLEKQSREIREV